MIRFQKHTRLILSILAISISFLGVCQEKGQDRVKFTWGAGFTGTIDMSGHDMSAIGMDAYFGMSTPGVQILGVGIGINEPVSNSYRSMPIYLLARSSFSVQPKLCFMDLRCGLSVNNVEANITQTGEYLSVGWGIKLASSNKFTSHLILSYILLGRRDFYDGETEYHLSDLNMVAIRLGISF